SPPLGHSWAGGYALGRISAFLVGDSGGRGDAALYSRSPRGWWAAASGYPSHAGSVSWATRRARLETGVVRRGVEGRNRYLRCRVATGHDSRGASAGTGGAGITPVRSAPCISCRRRAGYFSGPSVQPFGLTRSPLTNAIYDPLDHGAHCSAAPDRAGIAAFHLAGPKRHAMGILFSGRGAIPHRR